MWSVTGPAPAADRAAGRTVRCNAATLPAGLRGAGQAAAPVSAAAPGAPKKEQRFPAPTAKPPGGLAGLAATAPRGTRPGGWGLPGATGRNQLPRGQATSGGSGQDENHEVGAFLREVGLAQYAETLLSNGFDDMDTLLHIEDGDMKELGIQPCHVVKLRRRLQELQRHGSEAGAEFDDSHPVVSFLKDIGLCQYAETLLNSGFDELETLMDIEDADMRDLGIPRGHAVKLRRRIREYQGPQEFFGARKVPSAPHAGRRSSPTTPSASMPNDEMKTAVERSWERVQALGTYAVGELLYRHTFDIAPETIDLFPPEVRFKYRDWTADEGIDESNVYESPALRKLFAKFVNAIGCTVAGLHDFGRLVPMLAQLGSRHINYGVNETHWPILGKALIYTLRDCLGESFTSEVEAAWSMVYGFMSNIMIEGLRAARQRRAALAAHKGATAEDSDDSLNDGVDDTWNRQSSGMSTFSAFTEDPPIPQRPLSHTAQVAEEPEADEATTADAATEREPPLGEGCMPVNGDGLQEPAPESPLATKC